MTTYPNYEDKMFTIHFRLTFYCHWRSLSEQSKWKKGHTVWLMWSQCYIAAVRGHKRISWATLNTKWRQHRLINEKETPYNQRKKFNWRSQCASSRYSLWSWLYKSFLVSFIHSRKFFGLMLYLSLSHHFCAIFSISHEQGSALTIKYKYGYPGYIRHKYQKPAFFEFQSITLFI